MANSGYTKYLKEAISCLVDSNGEFKNEPSGVLAKRKLSIEKLNFLMELILLLRDSKFLCAESKMYLFNKYITIKGVSEELSSKLGKPISMNTAQSKIQYDKIKLEKTFGLDMFNEIYSIKGNIEPYEKILANLYVKYSHANDIKKHLLLEIPSNTICSEIEDDEFNEFISIIAPYTKNQVEFIQNGLDDRACGYFNYLISMPSLSNKDKERKERLLMLLGIEGK